MFISFTFGKNGQYWTVISVEDWDWIQRKLRQIGAHGHYITCRIARKVIPLHRLVMERAIGGPILKGFVVDHVNGNPRDNRRENLRICSTKENTRNRKIQSNSCQKHPGIAHVGPGQFRAVIRVDGASIQVGTYGTRSEACEAYQAAAKRHFGEFAREHAIPKDAANSNIVPYKGRWRVYYRRKGVRQPIVVGVFGTETEAEEAYEIASRRYESSAS